MQIGREADNTLSVIALDQPRHRSLFQRRNIHELRVLLAVLRHWQRSKGIRALDAILREFDLDLERLPHIAIDPVIRLGESRGGSGGHNGADNISS